MCPRISRCFIDFSAAAAQYTDVIPQFRSSDHYLINIAVWSEMAERLLDVELFWSLKAH